MCFESKGESAIRVYLEKRCIKFKYQAAVKSRRMIFDFAIKISGQLGLIEYQGTQHYVPHSFNSDQSEATKIINLIKSQKKDSLKVKWCAIKGYSLLIIPYWDYKNIPEILNNFIISMEKNAKEIVS